MKLRDLLTELSKELSDFSSCAVVDRQEGASICTISAPNLDAPLAEAYTAELLRQHRRLLAKLATPKDDDAGDELVLSTSGAVIVARELEHSEYFWMLVAAPTSNVTLLRALMRKYHPRVAQALP